MMALNLSAFLQLKVNIFLYRKLGWKLTFIYIMFLGNLYFLFKRKEKKKIKDAITTVFENQKNPEEIKTIVKRVFRGILWHYFEKVFNVTTPIEQLTNFFIQYIKTEGIAALDKGLARGKGVLLVTGHFGGIEYIPKFLAVQNYPVTILAKFSSERLRNLSMKQADHLAINLIDADHCPNIIRAITDNLKKNRIVITQCDEIEKWKPSVYTKMVFLGKRILLDKTINTLFKRVDTALVFALMHRKGVRKFTFIAHSWNEIPTFLKPSANQSVGEMVLRYLEYYIYHFPEEWYQWKKVLELKTTKEPAVSLEEIESPIWMIHAFDRPS